VRRAAERPQSSTIISGHDPPTITSHLSTFVDCHPNILARGSDESPDLKTSRKLARLGIPPMPSQLAHQLLGAIVTPERYRAHQ
jgi:hypothetical protein